MPVFLSHKREDEIKTLEIANYLRQNDIICYVDVLDPTLQTTDDITSKLIYWIGMCTHLMAVVSERTTVSWWVPFEIGVGTEKNKRITSFQLDQVGLPDFLRKWPVLKTKNHLDTFIKLYKQDGIVEFRESQGYSKTISSADQFHARLKLML
jgi:hypothetical protein